MSYGRCFTAWRAAAGSHWDDYVRHRFVQGMADGTLPRAGFLNYLVQDYRFLIHFSRAWGLGIVKADTLEEMRACAASLPTRLRWGPGVGCGLPHRCRTTHSADHMPDRRRQPSPNG